MPPHNEKQNEKQRNSVKKYTIIFTHRFMSGCHMQTMIQYRRCELKEGENVRDMLVREELLDDAIFIFEGHPLLEGESTEKQG